MNWEAAQAPTHPMPTTYWWGWAGLAVAIHGVAALSLWWLAQGAPSVAGEVVTKKDVSATANANEQRLVWVSRADVANAGEQAGDPLDKVRLQARTKPTTTQPTTAQASAVQARAEQPVPVPVPVPVAVAISGQAVVKPSQGLLAQSDARSVAKVDAKPSDQFSPAPSAADGATAIAANAGTASAIFNRAPAAVQASSPPPDYPALSRRLGEQGEVVLRVQVSAGGQALAVELAKPSGFDRLDRAALQAVAKWRFVPVMVNGQVQTAWFEVPVRFELR